MKLNKELIKKLVDKYTEEKQLLIAMEELSELQKEISKYIREKNNKEELAEEIADVLIMIDQIKYITEVRDEAIEKYFNIKTKRIEGLI